MTDELPAQVIRRDIDRRQLIEDLYEKGFPSVARFVKKMGGGSDEARDIFQDTLVIFYEKITQGNLHIDCSPQVYIMGIAKHLWIRKYKKDQQIISLDAFEKQIKVAADDTPSVSAQQILRMLEQSGEKCMELLKSFYYDKLSMKRIKEMFGYGSERSATVQKYKCIEKIRNEVKAHNRTYEDFFE